MFINNKVAAIIFGETQKNNILMFEKQLSSRCRKQFNPMNADALSGSAVTEEDLEAKKHVQIHKACNFTISILIFVVFLEAIDHVYVLKLPGSPL